MHMMRSLFVGEDLDFVPGLVFSSTSARKCADYPSKNEW